MSDSISDTLSEKISSLVDDEQTLDQTLMDSLSKNGEAKAKWTRYNLVSDILNDRDQHEIGSAWFEELNAKLKNEPAILAPRISRTFKQKAIKQLTGFAVAATVAMVAIISVQQSNDSTIDSTASIASLSTHTYASSDIKPVTLRLNSATESKLSGYLVNHYEHSVSGKMQGVIPYMRFVSVTPSERIVNEK